VDPGHFDVPANGYMWGFALLAQAGMTPVQAIQAGTRAGAEVMGWDDRLGTLGKLVSLCLAGR